ncbi:10735_t:CDS:2 [Paraglomus occultum]|uniref:10735_t:CDS:1 n=1 Tax=Paraglomus occultum TaxID=144539 RepID=A0A9N8VKN2_9GLOM|nr:10735_t:CDS:2 [Paraglomus occultum]
MSFNEFSLHGNPEIYLDIDNIVSQGYSANLLSLPINDNNEAPTESLPTNATLEYCQDISTFVVKCNGEELVSFLIEKEAMGSNAYMRFRGEFVRALKQKGNDLYKDMKEVSKLTSIAWNSADDRIKDKFRRNSRKRKVQSIKTNTSQSFTCPDCGTSHEIPSQPVKLIYAETTTTTQSIKCSNLKCQRKHKLVATYKVFSKKGIGMC